MSDVTPQHPQNTPETPQKYPPNDNNRFQVLEPIVSFQGAEHNGKGLKALTCTIFEIPHSIFSKHIFAKKVAFFHS